MSRTFLALLLLSSVVAAQPLEGPFDVMAVDSGLHIATPCLAAHDSVIEIFYTLHSPGANEVQRIVYNLETHQTIGDPVTMRHDTAWDQRLVNAEIQPNGDRAVMVNLVGNSCSGVLCLLETASGVRDFVLEEGCWVQGDYWFLSSWFTYHHVRRVPGGRFVAAWVWNGFYGFEYIESVWEGRIAYFSGDSLEAVQEVLPDSMIYGSDVLAIAPLAFDRTLALMRGSFVGPSTLAVVPRSSDPFFGAGVELPCDMLPLDFRLTPGGRMIALSRDSSESLTPAVFEVDTLGNCTQLGSLTWNRRPGSPAWHPNWGWVIPYQETCCLLVGRLDTLGQEVQPVGVIFERDSVWAIVEACASISDDGRIVAVWSERRESNPNATRLRLATVGWDTHLGTDGDRFIPQPSAISLSAYPNPFNHFLRIEYGVSRTQAVNLSVFNVLGQRVATLHDGLEQAGTHVMDWSPQTSGGVYFLNLRTPDATRTSKVLFIP